jgi:hypothetical protein
MANAQIVNIPDANFKAALVNNPAINTNGDGEIQVTEAAAYNGYMYVSSIGIADLTGIETFTALDSLACNDNQLTSLDVSANTALTTIDCSINSITSLDVSTNTALISLNCSWNQLTSLDVSATTALTDLVCFANQLTSLNVSANTALTDLSCGGNQLTSLDVSSNTALTDLGCEFNPLMNLDVSANTALTFLSCSDIQITSLDVSANTALTFLNCHDNQLTSLDFSANTALTSLYCYSNQLTSLNVQNGYNTNFTIIHAINNPNLTCIQVDNVAYSNAHWSNGKDATASFSTDCGVTSVPDIDKLAAVKIIPNPANDYVTIDGLNNIQKIELINMQGQVVKTILVNDNSSLIDVSSFANGIYQLKLSSSNQAKTMRLVVAH